MENSSGSKWIDVTVDIENAMVHWPGDVEVVVTQSESISKGQEYNVTALTMSAHTGTHVDAPFHILELGYDVTRIPLEALIGPVKIFAIEDPEQITLHEIKDFPITEHDRIFFKTKNSEKEWAHMSFQPDHVYLASDAAMLLQSRNVYCVGIDYLSIAGKINNAKVHNLLLGSGICVIEGLNLKDVQPGEYDMICLPMKLKGADGAPARVVIRKKNPVT